MLHVSCSVVRKNYLNYKSYSSWSSFHLQQTAVFQMLQQFTVLWKPKFPHPSHKNLYCSWSINPAFQHDISPWLNLTYCDQPLFHSCHFRFICMRSWAWTLFQWPFPLSNIIVVFIMHQIKILLSTTLRIFTHVGGNVTD
jgi:hypothetical protein